jgi:serine/threonine protein kinase/DNA-binding response OmpR family regulator
MEQTQVTKGLSVQELLDSLKESGLLSDTEMETAAKATNDAKASGLSLAQALVASGVLTSFQAEAFCNRTQSELRIGNYDVLDKLGVGGMGTVFKARHRRMKRVVALKLLSRTLAKDDTFVQRFLREVETIARFTHPNIVIAYDADEAEAGHFLVMEFVDGQDLSSFLEKQGPLSVSAAVNCILQAARGLAYAHAQGIIHRDIKPANLLRDSTGAVKVTDLGLARLAGVKGTEGAGSITQAGSILGTVDYMPPEQAMGATDIDHRADIYSLGATLHFLLLRRPPYQGETLMATMFKHKMAPIPSLVQGRADVPPALDALFARMMAKEPADRYQSMAEVVRVLEEIEASLPPASAASSAPAALGATAGAEPAGLPSQVLKTTVSATSGVSDRTMNFTPAAALPPRLAALKVLLVEPSRTQSAIIRKYLQMQGIQNIAAAASGQEALQAARAQAPDAIVSALHLPDMTGVQLAQKFRSEACASTPGFVMISSEFESSSAGSLSACGKAVLVKKPFSPEQLLEALRVVSDLDGSTPALKQRAKLRVLIVDDSTPARLHVRQVLSTLGLTTFVEAGDGAQAVAAVARETFDLIVTDYNMPFLDGSGLVGYLRQNPATARVPIIMVTTETDPAKLEVVKRWGVTAICEKSFPAEIVRKIIDDMTSIT